MLLHEDAAPFKEMSVEMFLHEWALEVGLAGEIERYEGACPFELLVNSMERTFADKVFAICDYYLADEPIPARQSRHIYDLRKLQGSIVFGAELQELFAQVRRQRLGKHRCPSAEHSVNLAGVLRELADSGAYKQDYANVTTGLLYDGMPYEEAAKALYEIADFVDDVNWAS